jgi:dihydroorotate dehydrogenase (fumarate)
MNLQTTYMGMKLESPLIASAGPLCGSVENIKRMEDAGAAGVVMFSLFEEQLRHEAEAIDYLTNVGRDSFGEALSYLPEVGEEYSMTSDRYLGILARASSETDIPVMGSLNGVSTEGWIEYATQMQSAGAAALELNIYYIPADMNQTGLSVEQQYLDVLKAVKEAVDIPVALKLSPFFSAMANMAGQLDTAGADALVLFNRFYQPDIDLESMDVTPNLSLSSPYEIRLPLMWIGILYGRIEASIAASRGVHNAKEIIKYVLAGADVVMTTSALLREGVDYLSKLLEDVSLWMDIHEFESISQMKGSLSMQNSADPGVYERANYIKMLESYKGRYAG